MHLWYRNRCVFFLLPALIWALMGLPASGHAQGAPFVLSPEEQTYLADKKHLNLCVDPNWMPYESIDAAGQHIGIAADYMDLYSKMMGVPFQLVRTQSWSESLQHARVGACDIVSLLNKTEERSEYLDFTSPYLNAAVVLVARNDVVYLNGFGDLSGRTLGVVEGYVYESHIRENFPDVRLVYVNDIADALLRVSKGEIFAAVDSLFIVTQHMQNLGLSNLKIAGQTDFTHALRVGVRKGDPVLQGIMEKAVSAVKPLQRNEILQRWFSVRFEHGTDYAMLWQVLGGVALMMAFLGYRFTMQSRFNKQLKAKNAALVHLSQTDPLTGVYNRLKTDELLDQELERSRRYGRGLSVVMFDLDHFKRINDTYGHQAGDKVLVQCSELVSENIRKFDTLGRWGGEEFIILCPETSLIGAEQLAEHLRALLAGMKVDGVGSITASFGVAELAAADNVQRLIGHADEALYISKKQGRNRVTLFKSAVDQEG